MKTKAIFTNLFNKGRYKMKNRFASITLLLIYLLFPSGLFADSPWYVIPVKIIMLDNTVKLGFLTLYGNEIRGYESEDNKKEYIIAFGMNKPSTETLKWEGLGYDFSSISLSNKNVIITFNKLKYVIKNVNFFLSKDGIEYCFKIWTNKNGILEKESSFLSVEEVKSIERIGEILNIPAYSD